MPARRTNPDMDEWFKSEEFRKSVERFHDKYARIPREELDEANPFIDSLMQKIRNHLQAEGICQRLEYTGSAYEGLKTVSGELEYDIMCILTKGEHLTAVKSHPVTVYASLMSTPYEKDLFRSSRSSLTRKGKVSSTKTRAWFRSVIQQALNALDLGEKIIIHDNGPAKHLEVKREGKCPILVDFVAIYEVEGKWFVAKPMSKSATDPSWRLSFSDEEKRLLSDIDRNGGCRRQCARILKAIIHKDDPLKPIPSYFVKTMLIHYKDLDWRQEKLGERLVDLMQRLSAALKANELDHAFVPGANILTSYYRKQRMNMCGRINSLLASKKKFQRLLCQ